MFHCWYALPAAVCRLLLLLLHVPCRTCTWVVGVRQAWSLARQQSHSGVTPTGTHRHTVTQSHRGALAQQLFGASTATTCCLICVCGVPSDCRPCCVLREAHTCHCIYAYVVLVLLLACRCVMPIGAGFVVAYLQKWGFSPALKFLTRAIEGVVDDSKNAAYPTSYWQVSSAGDCWQRRNRTSVALSLGQQRNAVCSA